MESFLDIILKMDNLLGSAFVRRMLFPKVDKTWKDKSNKDIDAEISAYLS